MSIQLSTTSLKLPHLLDTFVKRHFEQLRSSMDAELNDFLEVLLYILLSNQNAIVNPYNPDDSRLME
jgi:hypothetical protein